MPGSTTWLSEGLPLIFLLILCILIAFGNTVVRCLSRRGRRVGAVQEAASCLTAEVRVRRALPAEAAGGPVSPVGPGMATRLLCVCAGAGLPWGEALLGQRHGPQTPNCSKEHQRQWGKCDYFNLTFSGN